MCGIVGYIGQRDACPVIIKGLKRLEIGAMIVRELHSTMEQVFMLAKPKVKSVIWKKKLLPTKIPMAVLVLATHVGRLTACQTMSTPTPIIQTQEI